MANGEPIQDEGLRGAAAIIALGHSALAFMRDFDSRASSWLYRRNRGVLGSAAIIVSALGSERLLILCAIVAALAALLEQQFTGALVLALVTVITHCCFSLFKQILQRSRPAVSGLSSNSFPSGHTMASMAVYGTGAAVLTRSHPAWLPTIVVTSGLLATSVGIARVIRGFHWLTDAAAGVVSGLALFTLAYIGLRYL